jgi:hypothetical protein
VTNLEGGEMASKTKTKLAIEFSCAAENEGIIPAPFAAKNYLPNWFRVLPAINTEVVSAKNSGLTVKRCMPFLDAMTAGWIIPLAATMRLEIKNEGSQVDYGWDFDKKLAANHGSHQVKGHPLGHLPPCKFLNFWTIRTPPGWSSIFVTPLNRPNGVFELAAGIVDTDSYDELVHFPFFATGPDGLHVLEKGTPIAQVIPFNRESIEWRMVAKAETEAELESRKKAARSISSTSGWYRENVRAKRNE